MSEEIINKQLEVYQSNFIAHGDTPMGMRWNNKETQYLRFNRLTREILAVSPHPFSIHDIGSGTCDLHTYLLENNIEHEYSGTEIVKEMIDSSLKKYPGIKLYNRNIMTDPVKEHYDFVVASGTFNMPGDVSEDSWKGYVFNMLKKMFDMSSCGIAFNLLTTYKTLSNESLFYLDPREVVDFCQTDLSRFVILDHSYALYEYTVTVLKKDYVKSLYREPLFDKYFK